MLITDRPMSPLWVRYRTVIPRFACLLAACGWGISVVAVFGSRAFCFATLEALGNTTLPDSVALDYWLRMTAVSFCFIGVLFVAALFARFRQLRILLGGFHLALAATLTVFTLNSGIQFDAQMWDAVFLLVTGIPVLAWGLSARW